MGRLGHIDALRAIAIGLVLCFHNLGPPGVELVPYGDRYADYFVMRIGWVGVELFFLISGYVILMSLESARGIRSFMFKRWLRLFPAMLLATVLIFAVRTAYAGPLFGPAWQDVLPGLTFISPSFYHLIFRFDFKSLDGVFWTLYTEVSFYILFAGIYLRFGRRCAITALIGIALTVSFGPHLFAALGASPLVLRLFEPFLWISWQLFGWFAAGALFYCADCTGSRRTFLLACSVGLLSALIQGYQMGGVPEILVALVLMVAIFAATLKSPLIQQVLANRALIAVGFASYPFYLLHNGVGRVLLNLIHAYAPALHPLLTFAFGMALVFALSYGVAYYFEPALRRNIRALVKQFGEKQSPDIFAAHPEESVTPVAR